MHLFVICQCALSEVYFQAAFSSCRDQVYYVYTTVLLKKCVVLHTLMYIALGASVKCWFYFQCLLEQNASN